MSTRLATLFLLLVLFVLAARPATAQVEVRGSMGAAAGQCACGVRPYRTTGVFAEGEVVVRERIGALADFTVDHSRYNLIGGGIHVTLHLGGHWLGRWVDPYVRLGRMGVGNLDAPGAHGPAVGAGVLIWPGGGHQGLQIEFVDVPDRHYGSGHLWAVRVGVIARR